MDYEEFYEDEFYEKEIVEKTPKKSSKKDFNKEYDRKMKSLLKEADMAEKAARKMFGRND